MAKSDIKVYLDHHIKRDNLLYKRATHTGEAGAPESYITIRDLVPPDSLALLLRKPDFQRATWAWTPEDCVDLLESVLKEQVVPSVIMWLSPEAFQYVLDGGHRISVLIAWVEDDWGDKRGVGAYKDEILETKAVVAARQVRDLLKRRGIGSFKEYRAAARRYQELRNQGKSPEQNMDAQSLAYAKIVRRWKSVRMGFPVQWVKGDYANAEKSFLKINKSGRQLTEWETKLVENRTSSFARAVMSIAQFSNPEHCWPASDDPVVDQDIDLQQKVPDILKRVVELHDLLFTPIYKVPIDDARQPLFATPYTQPEKKAKYLAELLTITEGKRGQEPETEALITKDKEKPPEVIIENGLRLVNNAYDVLSNIYGHSPRSLGLMPLVYFYNAQGVYVRSLLYGMLYWLNSGSQNSEVQDRKKLFTIHRKAFEQVILDNKEAIISRITRRIGSGSEVTYATARYYEGLLILLIQHSNVIDSDVFRTDHLNLIETLGSGKVVTSEEVGESKSRVYKGKIKTGVHVRDFLKVFQPCGICGGLYYPGLFTQVDHIEPYADGGPTSIDNGRNTHPFCNNNRKELEKLMKGEKRVKLPQFVDPETLPKAEQLRFSFTDEDPEDFAIADEEAVVNEDADEEGL
jgi:hypothetical protein